MFTVFSLQVSALTEVKNVGNNIFADCWRQQGSGVMPNSSAILLAVLSLLITDSPGLILTHQSLY